MAYKHIKGGEIEGELEIAIAHNESEHDVVLDSNSVAEDFSVTATDGKNYTTKFYNLDASIAVGYRVNSKQATHFRIWATNTLKAFVVKGFVLNDEMLKNEKPFGTINFRP
jgi:hypothetical protein